MTSDHLDHYREFGYAVVKGVFSPDEIEELAHAFDRIYAQGLNHGRAFRHGNTFFNVTRDAALDTVMRMMQWPSYIDPVMNKFRLDKRMLDIVSPLIGRDLKQIINQMHWKPPGAAMVEFGYHQDIRSRRPRWAYRDPANSYIQTGIAVDPHLGPPYFNLAMTRDALGDRHGAIADLAYGGHARTPPRDLF